MRKSLLVLGMALLPCHAEAICQRSDGTYTNDCTVKDTPVRGGRVSSAGDGYAPGSWDRLAEVHESNMRADKVTAEIAAKAKADAREAQRQAETIRTQQAIRDAADRVGRSGSGYSSGPKYNQGYRYQRGFVRPTYQPPPRPSPTYTTGIRPVAPGTARE